MRDLRAGGAIQNGVLHLTVRNVPVDPAVTRNFMDRLTVTDVSTVCQQWVNTSFGASVDAR